MKMKSIESEMIRRGRWSVFTADVGIVGPSYNIYFMATIAEIVVRIHGWS
jgi:hypothetical protein